MTCPSCGEENREDALICGLCRRVFRTVTTASRSLRPTGPRPKAPPEPVAEPPKPPRRRPRWVLPAAGGAVLLLLATTVTLLVRRPKATDSRTSATAGGEAKETSIFRSIISSVSRQRVRTRILDEIPPPPLARLAIPAYWMDGPDGYARALREQERTFAPMVIFFRSDNVPASRRVDQDLFPATAVRKFLSEVIRVRVTPDGSAPEREVARRFGVTEYPTVFVSGGLRWPVTKVLGLTETTTPEAFITTLKALGLSEARELAAKGAEKVRAGDLQGGRADLDQAINLDKRIGDAYIWRGLAWARGNRIEFAEPDLRRGIEMRPTDPYPHSVLALMFARANRHHEAIEALTGLIVKAPSWHFGWAFGMRAHSFNMIGEEVRARTDLEEACRRGHAVSCAILEK